MCVVLFFLPFKQLNELKLENIFYFRSINHNIQNKENKSQNRMTYKKRKLKYSG